LADASACCCLIVLLLGFATRRQSEQPAQQVQRSNKKMKMIGLGYLFGFAYDGLCLMAYNK
jgi:hypothetical protein